MKTTQTKDLTAVALVCAVLGTRKVQVRHITVFYFLFISRPYAGKVSVQRDTQGF